MKSCHIVCRALLVLTLFGVLATAAPVGLAQAPLNFSNNFFVTGDYVVAGAYNMASTFQTIGGVSYAVGTINVPDTNPGIQGVKQVPKGAQIIAALLYWQSVEKTSAIGSGASGYFRPLLYAGKGGPAVPGYAIQGTPLDNEMSNPVPTGCSGTANGKVIQTYRADVVGGLPNDANGNPTANGSFELRLPSTNNGQPFALGATLVVIYRIPGGPNGPNVPLNSIVIYEGDFAQNNAHGMMIQPLQGFYDADKGTISRLTHIVASGASNKNETVFLSSGTTDQYGMNPVFGKAVALPSPYPNQLPAFPGWYGNWDNPTWTFPSGSSPLLEDASIASTQVVRAPMNQACVSWGAVILSTTVKDSDKDGLLDSWENNQGYCDASVNGGMCTGHGDPAWVDLSGADPHTKDVFLQYDYMCSSISGGICSTTGGNYSFDPKLAVDTNDGLTPHEDAVEKVVAAYAMHNITLHPVRGNAISESDPNITCGDSDLTCPYPNEPGVVGFRFGLENIKNSNINTQTGMLGAGAPVFQHGKKDSYHYALFSHGVGVPQWFLYDGSLSSVKQAGNTVTFTASSPHGIAQIMQQPNFATKTDGTCKSGRVTVVFAVSNPNLNGTFCVKNVTPTTFQITVPGASTNVTYTSQMEPYLGVANGQVTSMSGYSDVGGQNSVIALGEGGWGPASSSTSDGNKWQTKAGTLMHEVGHAMALTHGATYYNNLPANPNDYTATFEVNCKPNLQSSMNYLFQFDLLQVPGQLNAKKQPLMVVDYSEETLPTLAKNSPEAAPVFNNPVYGNTAWFQLQSYAGGTAATPFCGTTPIPAGYPSYSFTSGPASTFFWTNTNSLLTNTGEDLNYDGNSTDVMHGHDEWDGSPASADGLAGPSFGIDLQQISAIGTLTTTGAGGGHLSGGGGGGHLSGGGGGGHLSGGGGGGHLSGGGGLGNEITHESANSYARPPSGLTITQEEASPRVIDLSWFVPTFGQILQYNIYRTVVGTPFPTTPTASVPGSKTMFQDTVSCNPNGYQYKVTAVTNNDQGQPLESTASNIVPASDEPLLTGCYTSPVNVAVEARGVQGDLVPVTWTLTDDFYTTPPAPWSSATSGNPVTNLAASTLVANGPLPGNCTSSGPTTILSQGVPQKIGDTVASTFVNTNSNTGLFTFNWDTDGFCAGSYTLKLTLDSGQSFTSSALQLSIDVGDQEPRIMTPTLNPGTVGLDVGNNDPIMEDGGTAPFTWSVTGLPLGISFSPVNPVYANQITLSGSTCAAGTYSGVTATVTDAKSNKGSQVFTLVINKASTTTTVSADPSQNPSVFQQTLAYTVTVKPQHGCIPTGNVTLFVDGISAGSSSLDGSGTAMIPVVPSLQLNPSIGMHSITASYTGDANFNASNNYSTPYSQTVNPASTQIAFNSSTPSPAFVGQPITVSWTFSVKAPGAGSPMPPSGNISVTATDGTNNYACMPSPPANLGAGMCTLTPAAVAAGNVTFAINYPGDGNFVSSGQNGNFNVYKLVFTTQPSNTGVGLPINGTNAPPGVVVTAEDSGGNPLTSFGGQITLAIANGPGTLSGTNPQTAVNGAATFPGLSINKIATGDTLKASPDAGATYSLPSAAFNIDTFYVDSQGNFGTLDLQTGTVSQIGDTPNPAVPGATGIDLTPGLQIFTYTALNQLMQITPSTGIAAGVSTTGSIPDQATTGALTDGTYFGIDAVNGNLYSINVNTGVLGSLGTTSAVILPPGCTLDSSLTGSANVLYYTVGFTSPAPTQANPNPPPCSAPKFDTLYQINPSDGTTAAGTPAAGVQLSISGSAGSGVNEFVGSAFVGGTLYGFTSGGQIYTIDTATGIATSPVSTTPTTSIIGAGGQ